METIPICRWNHCLHRKFQGIYQKKKKKITFWVQQVCRVQDEYPENNLFLYTSNKHMETEKKYHLKSIPKIAPPRYKSKKNHVNNLYTKNFFNMNEINQGFK